MKCPSCNYRGKKFIKIKDTRGWFEKWDQIIRTDNLSINVRCPKCKVEFFTLED